MEQFIHCSSTVHPLGDKSPIAGFLKKNPRGGIHHICIEVDNLDEACKTLAESDITALSPKSSVRYSTTSVECVRYMNGIKTYIARAQIRLELMASPSCFSIPRTLTVFW